MFDLRVIALDAADELAMSDVYRHMQRFADWADRKARRAR